MFYAIKRSRVDGQVKWFAGICLLSCSCALAATNAVPSVAWSSRSGLGPFKEVQKVSYESAGWLKWLGEKHRLRCDIRIENGKSYVIAIDVPCNMQLTHVSCHSEWANRLTGDEHDFRWCKVARVTGWAEITIPTCPCKCDQREISLRLAFRESGWPLFRANGGNSTRFLVCDPDASMYDHGQKVYKELSDAPCATPLAAARAAERMFVMLYGNEVVSERPWRVTETNGCYLVAGSLPKGCLGGVAQLKLRKDDGRVWVYCHGK